MDNPLELQAPGDPIERIHALARDLAYGALTGKWPTKIPLLEQNEGAD